MPTMQTFRLLLAAALLCGWSSCCTPPAEDYLQKPYVQQQMSGLANAFLALLPPDKAVLPAAGAEARWLADTAVAQSAAIARDNRTVLFGWLNNILVNSNLRDRGLCWQVQQDLYRDLRRRPVKYFRVGLTIRDRGTGREHSCVYVNAAGKGLQGSIVLDAWKNCGHLVTLTQKDREGGKWEEDWREPFVSKAFPEGHSYGMEHHLVCPGGPGNAPCWFNGYSSPTSGMRRRRAPLNKGTACSGRSRYTTLRDGG